MRLLSFVLILILTFVLASGMSAQDLSKLKEDERNKKLIEIAKKEYSKEKYKEYYRIYGTPNISSMPVKDVPSLKNPLVVGYGSTPGDIFYMVEFPYDKKKEQFEEDYAAKVYIWEKTGVAFAIGLGNGYRLKVK